ncbi:DUF2254 domain-containing protein [Plantactinospora sp. KLBMP9567]|uniref:DUF2254 domain-containing protein n=1 Tax=Plantactinospora sp. KLBMP9567 TaxID=3085900 RepID=UPI00298138D1|nr:DUF2254 domain-containing protein [Plantactinospora sp. KLBMP9567]MDW5329687.1 DUF2254 domain-containing protein [Plantactinospora sp. KLBMP9567]
MSRPRSWSFQVASIWSSFWLLPALFAAASVALAIVLSAVEARLVLPLGGILPSGPAGARALLSSIITAMISFTALVFSITVVALQLFSSQYSPRALRTFLQDRGIQVVLGTFVATFLYSMALLATLPDSAGTRLPELSLTISIVMVLISVAAFIYYLHHMTTIMRVSHVIASIGAQTRRSVHRHLDPGEGGPATGPLGPVEQVLTAPGAGVVTTTDLPRLAAVADRRRCVLVVVPLPGEYVVAGAPLLRVHRAGHSPPLPVRPDEVFTAIDVGPERAPGQDIGFGFRQLADIAERALSPGINDITTAVRAIQEMHDLLRRLLQRSDGPHVVRNSTGEIRALMRRQSYESYLTVAIDDVRHAGQGQPRVLRLLASVLEDLAADAPARYRDAVDRRRTPDAG